MFRWCEKHFSKMFYLKKNKKKSCENLTFTNYSKKNTKKKLSTNHNHFVTHHTNQTLQLLMILYVTNF